MYNYFYTSRASAPVTIRAWNRLSRTREARRFHFCRESALADRIAQTASTQQTFGLCNCSNGAAMHGQDRFSV
jgi:hypothetical protein